MFFASFGAYILHKEYKIPARVVAGAFCLSVDAGGKVATFGKLEGDQLVSADDAFHMWVETRTHVVDFMAPIYREAFADQFPGVELPRKMMQRPISEEAPDLSALKRPGDFRYYPNPDLTKDLVDHFFDRPVNEDLLQIAIAWYDGRRAKQSAGFAMMDEKGHPSQLKLADTAASGAW
jgi:hypothetical protein